MEKFFISYIFNEVFCADEDEDEFLVLMSTVRFYKKRKCIENYYEEAVPRYTDCAFKSHFRLDRGTVEIVACEVAPIIIKSTGRPFCPIQKQILLCLWYLGNQEVFRSIANRFDLSKSTAHETIHRSIDAIISLRQVYIVWPDKNEAKRISQAFRVKNGFTGVMGCIDGSHIPINKPLINGDSYINRKGYSSLILQGVCDDKRRFIDVSCGWPGSMHDARVFRSELGKIIQENSNNLFYNGFHLLGDSAYPLMDILLTPYRDNGHLEIRKKTFNNYLSVLRIIIEHVFGILKTIFRILRFVNMYKTLMVPKIILGCCVLHNLCIRYADKLLDVVQFDEEDMQGAYYPETFRQDQTTGAFKRDYISSLF